MKKIKYIVLFFMFGILSCSSSIDLIEAKKTKHVSGLPTGKDYVDYKIKLNSKVDFSFKSLKLNNQTIENFFIKNLSSGLSSTKINSNIKKGAYQFGFRVYNTSLINTQETITLNYLINDKEFQLKKNVEKNKKIRANR